MTEIPKVYDPRTVEPAWYRAWLEGNFFRADNQRDGNPYCIVIPPPNITGSLHLGHALNNTLQDVLIRWRRMIGDNTLWLPGTDHAGIATQNVVERQLKDQGKDRESLGREKFTERVWEWRDESGRKIIEQLKRLGASCDWSRERFTLDSGLSAAVREVFVRLHDEGLIYRGERLINWCPRCQTALSDIEVEHEEVDGKMYYIRYPLPKTGQGSLTVATTRPETMLGDTAVAVHPDDPRYNVHIGKLVSLPLTDRTIPVVGDAILVDREFGTGAVKITPAHDFNDFESGERHGLPRIPILDEKARIRRDLDRHGVAAELLETIAGQQVARARERVVAALQEQNYLIKQEDHRHAVGRCYRCRSIVEPYLSAQWFVRIKPLALPAVDAVRSGRIQFMPKTWENSFFSWMEQIKDWCISRQIWWGHQIPAWYCTKCNAGKIPTGTISGSSLVDKDARPIVSRTPPKQCPKCLGTELVQDPDVLDTWFSSALWPFSTLGWPDQTQDLRVYYPTQTLVTSFDILFFWVARMIMMGLKFMKEVPFRTVYVHALVRDAEGQKMSKSKGNVIDPLSVMDRYGTDALRFTLAAMASPGRDIKLSESRIEGYRNFANKIWNAGRFILRSSPAGGDLSLPADPTNLSSVNRWILSRLAQCTAEVNRALKAYRFDEASNRLYHFIWHEFCDWYVEFSKVDLSNGDARLRSETIRVLYGGFESLLRLLHPFMPFITEELWQRLPDACRRGPGGKATSLTLAPYPRPNPAAVDQSIEREMQAVIELVTQIRRFGREARLNPAQKIPGGFKARIPESVQTYRGYTPYIMSIARLSEFHVGTEFEISPGTVTLPTAEGEVYLRLGGILDFEKERARVQAEIGRATAEAERLRKKLGNAEFRSRAPQEVVAKDECRVEEIEGALKLLQDYHRQLKEAD